MAEVVTQQTSTQVEALLGAMAQEFKTSERNILRQALRALLQHDLRAVNAQIFEITGRYDITSVAEMEARYQAGTLEEADSWRDLQQLDHADRHHPLEYKRDRLTEFLEALA